MCKDVIMEYVSGAMIDPKNYKKFLLVSGCVAMFGIIPGVLLKSYWLYIGVVMLLIFFICVCIMFGLSFKELTLKRKIKIQALIYVCWYLQIGLLSAIIYTHTYGINYKLFLLYLQHHKFLKLELLGFFQFLLFCKRDNFQIYSSC